MLSLILLWRGNNIQEETAASLFRVSTEVWYLATKLQGVNIGQFSFQGLNLVYGVMLRPLG